MVGFTPEKSVQTDRGEEVMKTHTTGEIMDLDPCKDWPIARVSAIVKDGLTKMQILEHHRISDSDKVWVVWNLLGKADEWVAAEESALFAYDVAYNMAWDAAREAGEAGVVNAAFVAGKRAKKAVWAEEVKRLKLVVRELEGER